MVTFDSRPTITMSSTITAIRTDGESISSSPLYSHLQGPPLPSARTARQPNIRV